MPSVDSEMHFVIVRIQRYLGNMNEGGFNEEENNKKNSLSQVYLRKRRDGKEFIWNPFFQLCSFLFLNENSKERERES